MKTLLKGLVGSLLMAFVVVGCGDYVQDVELGIGSVVDADLNDVSDITPFIRGVQTQFALVHTEGSLNNGGLADELFFSTNVRGATFPQYQQIDNGQDGILVPANNSVQNAWRSLGQFRFLCDNLRIRATAIKNALDPNAPDYAANAATCDNGIFYGHLYGAIARGMMADHYCLNPGEATGGGILDKDELGSGNSAYIPAAALRQEAHELLNAAVGIAPSPGLAATCWTIRARMYLYAGDYQGAQTAAGQGMTAGTAPVVAECNEATRNEWFDAAGFGRDQFMADGRFKAYVDADPTEAERIPLALRIGNDGETQYWQQNKYDEFASNAVYVSWQENNLIQAEVAIRSSDNPTALTLINAVRASHGVSDMTDERVQEDFEGDYLEMLYVERDKELCFTGLRGMDQNRFNRWHKEPLETHWRYIPISQSERNGNPNID